MYVDVTEVCEDWGVSRAQGYKIIKQLNDRMLAINPNLIVFPVRQIESFMRRTVMAWHKKHKKDLSPARERSITHQKQLLKSSKLCSESSDYGMKF